MGMAQNSLEDRIAETEAKLQQLKTDQQKLVSELEDLKLEHLKKSLKVIGHPIHSECSETVEHAAIALCYDEKHEQARWVMHMVTPAIIEGNVSRTNDFRVDPLVKTGTAVKADYWYSGFDRGHLAPSADFRWSKKALSESYLYSNMAPQRPELNREKWAELENFMRDYVIRTNEPIYMVTGGVLKEGLPTMQNEGRENEVSIPEYFYKVILDHSGAEKRGIGFIMSNGTNSYPVSSYAVSIDSIERLTNIDFFPNLAKEDEQLEASFNIKDWVGEEKKNEVDPLDPTKMPKGKFNTIQAKYHIGDKITVCGTVVSTKHTEKGSTFLNLDRKFPNHIFSVTIWKDAHTNFSYAPATELMNQKVCITGLVTENRGTPTMNVVNEKAIVIIEEGSEADF
jgi:endonuclease G